ncbi:hypothetical protein BU26DRAFT_517403 [Trematosphaeria pertusa]|uniref:Uncharacterized protein n=1 Tax=Trematosphaeria pertusa TaxID=390896 RepID=A0A6A6IM08_9PLEO|nr:uncharacterized protein BU26DRAFT_517403 [Trematosphaeria pertusa]KAF2250570.1 hypothetical protein BU26DRAFT_517403 [Trematosphaeria pertusa]
MQLQGMSHCELGHTITPMALQANNAPLSLPDRWEKIQLQFDLLTSAMPQAEDGPGTNDSIGTQLETLYSSYVLGIRLYFHRIVRHGRYPQPRDLFHRSQYQ